MINSKKPLTDTGNAVIVNKNLLFSFNFIDAGMAELADALDLGSSVYDVQVQVLLPAREETVLVISLFLLT